MKGISGHEIKTCFHQSWDAGWAKTLGEQGTRSPLGSPKPLSKVPLCPVLVSYRFSEGLIHLLLLLVLFLTLIEEDTGTGTEVGHGKPRSFTGGETQSILQLWRRQNLLHHYSKGHTELNMRTLNFMFIQDPAACISGFDPQRKFQQ